MAPVEPVEELLEELLEELQVGMELHQGLDPSPTLRHSDVSCELRLNMTEPRKAPSRDELSLCENLNDATCRWVLHLNGGILNLHVMYAPHMLVLVLSNEFK